MIKTVDKLSERGYTRSEESISRLASRQYLLTGVTRMPTNLDRTVRIHIDVLEKAIRLLYDLPDSTGLMEVLDELEWIADMFYSTEAQDDASLLEHYESK